MQPMLVTYFAVNFLSSNGTEKLRDSFEPVYVAFGQFSVSMLLAIAFDRYLHASIHILSFSAHQTAYRYQVSCWYRDLMVKL